jgi:hypothetical protein
MRTLLAALRVALFAVGLLEALSLKIATSRDDAGLAVVAQSAIASSTFPAQVDATLSELAMMNVSIESGAAPPDGCLLCHKSESGGLGTNNAFGDMMKAAGAVAATPGTVKPALLKLAQSNPRAIMDVAEGTNPNNDPSALSSDPVPEYGCGSIAGATYRGNSTPALVFGVSLLGVCLLRRRTPPSP